MRSGDCCMYACLLGRGCYAVGWLLRACVCVSAGARLCRVLGWLLPACVSVEGGYVMRPCDCCVYVCLLEQGCFAVGWLLRVCLSVGEVMLCGRVTAACVRVCWGEDMFCCRVTVECMRVCWCDVMLCGQVTATCMCVCGGKVMLWGRVTVVCMCVCWGDVMLCSWVPAACVFVCVSVKAFRHIVTRTIVAISRRVIINWTNRRRAPAYQISLMKPVSRLYAAHIPLTRSSHRTLELYTPSGMTVSRGDGMTRWRCDSEWRCDGITIWRDGVTVWRCRSADGNANFVAEITSDV